MQPSSMPPNHWQRSAVTLALGFAGAFGAEALGLPAAPLIGAAVASSAAAWGGIRLQVDHRLRDLGFLAVGLSLGSGVRPDVVSEAADWGVSLVMLCLSVLTTLWLSALLLRRFGGLDRDTSLLASAPGTLSLVMAMAAERKGDVTAITVIQSMRLLLLTAILPLAVVWVGGGSRTQPALPDLPVQALLSIVALGWLVSLPIKRFGFPAAFLLGGMIAGALGQLSGVVSGLPAYWTLFMGYALIGSVIGSRFTGITLRQVWAQAGLTVIMVSTAALVSGGFAVFVGLWTDIPADQLWIAYAPGGVEAMAAIGLALGIDPAFVALHHLVRIGVLMLCLPLLMRRR